MLNTSQGGVVVAQNQVSEQFRNLERSTLDTEKLITELKGKLRPILRDEQPQCDVAKHAPAETLVPLADEIRGVYRMAQRNVNALRTIIEHSEI